MELLEIAKANAAKALGITNLDLPASLRTLPGAKEAHSATAVPNNDGKFENSGVKAAGEETSSGLPKVNKKKSPYELWLPV
ncbi:arginine/serine-rich protein 1 [Echinops telfairi]|uniref:Arginine/serine-rich protein 1 n=1 Tax=Echinops telfairi TaxID=9371 RepID=A0ABM0ZR05_ECHTE|nr:arginine/serine-rich protein 1 [Echinops telfairi]